MCGATRLYVCVCRNLFVCDVTQSAALQPVPEKMRLEILVEMQIEILDGQNPGLFSNEPFKKRPVITIEDFDLHSNEHLESHLLGNWLYRMCGATCSCVCAVTCLCVT